MTPSGGELLAQRYRLEERIGVGAMGAVWRARDLRLQRDVAVKRVRLDGHVDAAAQARFRREAVAMAGVSHPNVVSVYDAGTDHGPDGETAYLVMELLDGPSCAELVSSAQPLSIGEVERIGAGVARGLAAAHQAGVVHRDIKPGNIVLSRGVATIVDFGIARLEQEATATLTAPQTTIGTAAYMSPEQALGKPVGPASDVYSLGALIMALASGSPPFGASNALALMRAHVDDPPPSLAQLRDDAPPGLVTLVDRMLAKEPIERPTAAEVARVLGGEADTDLPLTPTAVLPAVGAAPGVAAAAQQSAQVVDPTAPAGPPVPAAYPRTAHAVPTPSRSRSAWIWWLLAAALVVAGVLLAMNLLGDRTQGTLTDDPTTPVSGTTESVITPLVTPSAGPTTEPVPTTEPEPEPEPTEPTPTETLDEAVADVDAAIGAVEDSDARDDLTKVWQRLSGALEESNAVDKARDTQREADKLLSEEDITPAEHEAIVTGVDRVIALL